MDNVESVVPIASDHGGFEMKSYIIGRLMEDGHEVRDYGVMSPESVDYPDFIHPLSKDIDEGKYRLGIIICGKAGMMKEQQLSKETTDPHGMDVKTE